jgi:hypothetical protein
MRELCGAASASARSKWRRDDQNSSRLLSAATCQHRGQNRARSFESKDLELEFGRRSTPIAVFRHAGGTASLDKSQMLM